MKYLIIGTAGHVDHGKTALIRALTGIETDRLMEEKQRGISIDLGFASMDLGAGVVAGIVDVPGHERFLKNMLAGTGGIDYVLLVIAADEGVMPQTREHLAMLSLYGIKQGIVVLNKIDKVESDWLDLVEEEVRGLLEGTFLETAPVCRVSAITGDGLDNLKQAMAKLAAQYPARDANGPFRLWIDRVFNAKGHGLVVTGSVLSGKAGVGDSLTLYPLNLSVRIRGLEWHGKKVETVYAGQRAAINFAGAEIAEVERGMSLSSPQRGQISNIWDARIEWREVVTSGTRIRLHLGTGEFLGRLYRFKDAGEEFARLIFEKPLAAGAGDRGILRLYSPQHLLGGAMLIAPGQGKRLGSARAALAAGLARGEVRDVVCSILAEVRGFAAAEDIQRQCGYFPDSAILAALQSLIKDMKIDKVENFYITRETLNAVTNEAYAVLKAYHREQPDRPGLSREILRQKLGIGEKAFDILSRLWDAKGLTAAAGADVALAEHAVKHSDWRQDLVARADRALADAGLANIDPVFLGEKLGLASDKARLAHDMMVKERLIIKVGDMHVYRKTIQYIIKLIYQHFQANQTITVAEFRDLLGTTRKVALPLLEYTDLHKYTMREGDVRRAGPKLKDLSE